MENRDEFMPAFRFEIEQMRSMVSRQLSSHYGEIRKVVEAKVEEALTADAEVQKHVKLAIEQRVREYISQCADHYFEEHMKPEIDKAMGKE